MPIAGPGGRFFGTTRGRIVALLRRGPQTVEGLAQTIGLTDNAIRAHLATLERDGLVRQAGVVRGEGAGKPATRYEVEPGAEPLFSRAYAPMLNALLGEIAERLPPRTAGALMQAVGRRLAANVPRPQDADLETRARAGVELLNSLGGDAQLEKKGRSLSIRGCGCPLSAATSRGAEACKAVAALLSEVIGAPVTETCDRGERPQCCFLVGGR
jgi:predicted ArsR family transcriptional regulator